MICLINNDSDEETARKKRIFSQIEYDNYYFLNVKEVENVVSLDCVINTLKVYNIPERNFNLNFDEIRYYESNNFYNFIIEDIFKGVKPNRFPIEKNKGKLKDQLVRKEGEFVNSFEDLTEEAQNVAREIYKFVKKNNPNWMLMGGN